MKLKPQNSGPKWRFSKFQPWVLQALVWRLHVKKWFFRLICLVFVFFLLVACGNEPSATSGPNPSPTGSRVSPVPSSSIEPIVSPPPALKRLTLNPITPDYALTEGAFNSPPNNGYAVWLRVATNEQEVNWLDGKLLPSSLQVVNWQKEILVVINMVGGSPQLFSLKLVGAELQGQNIILQIERKLPPPDAIITAVAVPYAAVATLSRVELPSSGQLNIILLDQQGQQLASQPLKL